MWMLHKLCGEMELKEMFILAEKKKNQWFKHTQIPPSINFSNACAGQHQAWPQAGAGLSGSPVWLAGTWWLEASPLSARGCVSRKGNLELVPHTQLYNTAICRKLWKSLHSLFIICIFHELFVDCSVWHVHVLFKECKWLSETMRHLCWWRERKAVAFLKVFYFLKFSRPFKLDVMCEYL